MEVKERIIPYKDAHPIKRLYLIGDLHSGTIAHSETHLDDAIETISNDRDALWVGTGDYGEWITPDDPRWQFKLIAGWVDSEDIAYSEQKYIVKKLKRIKDKCAGLQWGNHEFEFKRHKFGDVHQHICDELGVNNLGYSCFLDLIFRRENSKEAHLVRCCGTHGSSNAITTSGKQNILSRWMANNNAMIYWYAHMHDILHKARPYMDVDRKHELVNKEALGVVTGSFYKTYLQGTDATYAERRNYPLNKIGYPVIEINIEEMSLNFSEKVYLRG